MSRFLWFTVYTDQTQAKYKSKSAYNSKVFISVIFETQSGGANDVTLTGMTCISSVVRHT